MTCGELEPLLLGAQRHTLDAATQHSVDEHVATCVTCQRVADDERALDALLDARLPQKPASLALKRRLAARLPAVAPRRRRPATMIATASLAACTVLAIGVFVHNREPSVNAVVGEAVADHLRMTYREHRVDIESGGPHQVKPWFTGRLDFALSTVFGGDDEFTLEGGAVGYYLDRKAAALSYKHGLHAISLFVYRANGLAFPRADHDLGRVSVHVQKERGFSVIVWLDGELGYSLISDINTSDLLKLAAAISDQS